MLIILIPINGVITPPTPNIRTFLRSNISDFIGLYLTPFIAIGINIGIGIVIIDVFIVIVITITNITSY